MKNNPKQFTRAEMREKIKERLIISPELSNRKIASGLNVSHTTVAKVRDELLKSGSIIQTDTSDEWQKHPLVKSGVVNIAELSVKGLRAAKKDGVLDKMQADGLTSPVYALRKITKEKTAKAETAFYPIKKADIVIKCADITDGLPFIADNSVKLIATDPPYGGEYIGLYRHISEVASRVLTPDGVLAVMTGQSHLDEIFPALCSAMKYHWQIAYITPRSSPYLHWIKVSPRYKPILIFIKQNATYKGRMFGDVIKATPDNERDKHKWQQSPNVFNRLIEVFTDKGDLVCDPFIGSGTTALCCVNLGRKFIGSDVDRDCVNKAKKSIDEIFS